MTLLILLSLAMAAGLFGAEPGYLNISLTKAKPFKTEARREFHKKIDAHIDSVGPVSGTRTVRLRRVYPPGSEHNYNQMILHFRSEPVELDPAKVEPARSLAGFLKANNMTQDQYQTWYDSIFDSAALRGRQYREVATVGRIEEGDWVRVNWVRAAPGRTADLRQINVKYMQTAAKKNIESGLEKAWLFYALEFPASENDFQFFRVHVFKDSKSAQKSFTGTLSQHLTGPEYADLLEKMRGAAATTRVEIYQVEKVREPK